jgi:hypothetical protein
MKVLAPRVDGDNVDDDDDDLIHLLMLISSNSLMKMAGK